MAGGRPVGYLQSVTEDFNSRLPRNKSRLSSALNHSVTVPLHLLFKSCKAPSWNNRPFARSVTWYGISYAGTKVAQTFKTKESRAERIPLFWKPPEALWEAPMCNLCPSKINAVPCDRIVQKACC